jgi:hypothetical protein
MYKRISRKQAFSRFIKDLEVEFCPSKSYPSRSPFNLSIVIDSYQTRKDLRLIEDILREEWNAIVNNFKYYNCTSETGLIVHFYKKT